MSQAHHENIEVPDPGPDTGTDFNHMTLHRHSNLPKQATASTHQYHLFQRRIKNRGEYPIMSMDPGLFSHYIWKGRAKKTRRWRKAGKMTLMGSSYLCVVIVNPNNLVYTKLPVIDRSIFRCCCVVDLGVNSGPPAESTRYIQFLPC